MSLTPLNALSPIDGRYFNSVKHLSPYFSEFGLIRYRVLVEVEYFISLCEYPLENLRDFPGNKFNDLRDLYLKFSEQDAAAIKDIEKTTNHDVKAVEYFIKQKFDLWGLNQYKEFIHFGLTSQDINNTATPLLLKDFLNQEFYPQLKAIISKIENQADAWKNISLLARTHGQPASPTRLGKEMQVFSERLTRQLELLTAVPHSGKFGGATGNFNAHHVAYPHIDWKKFGDEFLQKNLGLRRNHPTTQIDHYDNLAAQLDGVKRINTILLDYCRDVWQYVSLNYFKQKIKAGEVGSSAMPHKVNPIDFENAEGNLGIANTILEHLSSKLPVSRLQRDLTDSTVLRNLGVPFAHTCIALSSLAKGIDKLELNETAIKYDLDENWAVVAEAIQTILRRENYPNPYETLKELTRSNQKITKETIHSFISSLRVSEKMKSELMAITPHNYTGI